MVVAVAGGGGGCAGSTPEVAEFCDLTAIDRVHAKTERILAGRGHRRAFALALHALHLPAHGVGAVDMCTCRFAQWCNEVRRYVNVFGRSEPNGYEIT